MMGHQGAQLGEENAGHIGSNQSDLPHLFRIMQFWSS